MLDNAQCFAEEFISKGYNLISGGTDTHQVLIDLQNKNISGKAAEIALDEAGITVNKNMIPYDPKSPFVTSGIRVGSPAITTRGMGVDEVKIIVNLIDQVILNYDNKEKENLKDFVDFEETLKSNLDEIFERFEFNHPIYILFSSGTTGKPKCITHGSGNVLIEHNKEFMLHCDIRDNEKLFYEKYGDDLCAEQHHLIRDVESCYLSSSLAVSLAKKYDADLHVFHLTTEKEMELFTCLLYTSPSPRDRG